MAKEKREKRDVISSSDSDESPHRTTTEHLNIIIEVILRAVSALQQPNITYLLTQ